MLYGLIHADYILKNRNIAQIMRNIKPAIMDIVHKYIVKIHNCFQKVYQTFQVKLWLNLYNSRKKMYQVNLFWWIHQNHFVIITLMEPKYFGTSFPHMLFIVYPEYRLLRPGNQFMPRFYDFKIHGLPYQIRQRATTNVKIPLKLTSFIWKSYRNNWKFIHIFIKKITKYLCRLTKTK